MRNQDKTKTLAYPYLPADYDLYDVLDMAKDISTFKKINICALIVAIFMVIIGRLLIPFSAAFSMGGLKVAIAAAAMFVGMVVYIFIHEWVHGVFIRIFTGEKAEYGFVFKSGMAYAKSSWFFGKLAYIIIALAPIVVCGVVFAALLCDVSEEYFWYLYMLQIFNFSGAAGDLYVAWRVMHMPKGLLVYDEGVAMKFFAPVTF